MTSSARWYDSFGWAHLHLRSGDTARRIGSTIGFTSGVWGEAEAIPMSADTRAQAPGVEGICIVTCAGSEQSSLAKAHNRTLPCCVSNGCIGAGTPFDAFLFLCYSFGSDLLCAGDRGLYTEIV